MNDQMMLFHVGIAGQMNDGIYLLVIFSNERKSKKLRFFILLEFYYYILFEYSNSRIFCSNE